MFKHLAISVALTASLSAHATQSTFQPPESVPEGPSGKTTITTYGLIDLSIQHLTSGPNAPLAGRGQWRLADGTVYGPGTRFGLRINEDLGSGLSAGALLEAGFTANNQQLSQGGRIFGRQGYAFVKSLDYGEFRFGRQYMLQDDAISSTNPTGGTTVLAPGSITFFKGGFIPFFLDASRVDNSFEYISPTYNGFLFKAMKALKQGTQDSYGGIKGAYNKGPFGLEIVYEQSDALAPVNGHKIVNKALMVGTNYDFGPIKLFAGYDRGHDLTSGIGTQIPSLSLPLLTSPATQLKAYNLGASSLLAGRTLVFANIGRSTWTAANGQSVDITRYGAGATYFYTKQTHFFAAFGLTGGDLKEYVNEKKLYELGVRKFF